MLIKLIGDEKEIKLQNEWYEQLKKEEPDNEYVQNIDPIKSIDDIFLPYLEYIKTFSEEEKRTYLKIYDNDIDTTGCYISELNNEVFLERLTTDKLIDSTKENIKFIHRSYGVCDNATQVINYYKQLITDGYIDDNEKYVILMTPIFRRNESKFGWRWHKWGRYIGVQKHCHEYLYDDTNIELIYVFEIKHLK